MDLGILDFLFGARRFHFTEQERDRVYRLLYGESVTVLRAEHLPSGFSVLLSQSDAKRILPRLSEMGITPLSDRRLGLPYYCR